jgi:hypothetical protein
MVPLGRTPCGILPYVSWCRKENADGSVPCVQLSRDTEARVADTIREASSIPEGNDASPLPLVVGAAETAGAHVARGLGGGCPVRFDERCALQAR